MKYFKRDSDHFHFKRIDTLLDSWGRDFEKVKLNQEPYNRRNMSEVIEWCRDNLAGDFAYRKGKWIFFQRAADEFLFKLRWNYD